MKAKFMLFLLWCKKWWKWIVGGLALIGAFLFGILTRGKGQTVDATSDILQKKIDVDEEIKKKEQEDADARDKKLEEIEKEHQDTINKLNEEEQKNFNVLKDDPDALNDWLVNIGKQSRE